MINVEERTRHVAVIGGGITGLAAAYYLQKQAKAQERPLQITLIEATHRLGGKIHTLRKDGFVIERGPDSFSSSKDGIQKLAKELGIESKLVAGASGQWSIMAEDRLQPIPDGTMMGIPTKLGAFLASDLCSWSGKVRAAGDLVMPKLSSYRDQALGAFMRKRFGQELVENLIEPLLSGVYGSDIDRISLEAAFPEYLEVEHRHRSLVLGMKKTKAAIAELSSDKAGFQTFQGGMQTLVEALEKELGGCTVLKGVKVERVAKEAAQAVLYLNNASSIAVDEAIFALPHSKLQPLFEPFGLLDGLKEMPMTSVATITMAFSEQAINYPDNLGFIVARTSDYTITACSWADRKWPGMAAPPGKQLVRAYIGRVGDEAVVDLSDKEIEKIVLADLQKAIAIEAHPEFTVVSRWKDAMPQYIVGHKERIVQAKAELAQAFPMLQVAGSSFGGFDLADCVEQGEAAARELLNRL
ncbi:protoporphyrinogen oxidase [Planococcus sp. YIM B11945]|uniref:protoporphyrinogen oxidase n=1 Tax=Planococcus sp. YIM B11945 TaxID=3435410 RepID=UPI003D7E6AAD